MMNTLTDREILQQQYKTPDRLKTRISIHGKYSTNPMGFGNWIVSQYEIAPNFRILELGCGTGDMWVSHLDRLKNGSHLILTDFSGGMLESAKENLGNPDCVTFQVADIQKIPYDSEQFDVAIANMMLYHVPDLEKGLLEVRRILKPGGTFYCATYGEHGIVEYVESLLTGFSVSGTVNKNFTLQNGAAKLSEYFGEVEKLEYEDSLAVTDTEDLLDYIYSMSSMTNLNQVSRKTLREILEAKKENGVIHIPKEYGMFVCRKTG